MPPGTGTLGGWRPCLVGTKIGSGGRRLGGTPHPRELRVRGPCAGRTHAGYTPDYFAGLPAGRLGVPGRCGVCLPIGNGRCRWGNGFPTGWVRGGHDAAGVGIGLADEDGCGLGDQDGCGLADEDGCGAIGRQPGRKWKWWARCRRANPQYAAILLAPPAAFSSFSKAAFFCAAVPCCSARKKATQSAGTLKWWCGLELAGLVSDVVVAVLCPCGASISS